MHPPLFRNGVISFYRQSCAVPLLLVCTKFTDVTDMKWWFNSLVFFALDGRCARAAEKANIPTAGSRLVLQHGLCSTSTLDGLFGISGRPVSRGTCSYVCTHVLYEPVPVQARTERERENTSCLRMNKNEMTWQMKLVFFQTLTCNFFTATIYSIKKQQNYKVILSIQCSHQHVNPFRKCINNCFYSGPLLLPLWEKLIHNNCLKRI